jgi:hypothetical protein
MLGGAGGAELDTCRIWLALRVPPGPLQFSSKEY